ncbi:hypothetical protein ATANTOWER_021846, partial [Ataeniobius toweri]|nr:hypothetical protein [Ataeniobius toweri]
LPVFSDPLSNLPQQYTVWFNYSPLVPPVTTYSMPVYLPVFHVLLFYTLDASQLELKVENFSFISKLYLGEWMNTALHIDGI